MYATVRSCPSQSTMFTTILRNGKPNLVSILALPLAACIHTTNTSTDHESVRYFPSPSSSSTSPDASMSSIHIILPGCYSFSTLLYDGTHLPVPHRIWQPWYSLPRLLTGGLQNIPSIDTAIFSPFSIPCPSVRARTLLGRQDGCNLLTEPGVSKFRMDTT